MKQSILQTPSPFIKSSKKDPVLLIPVQESDFKSWLKEQDETTKKRLKSEKFEAQKGQIFFRYTNDGTLQDILFAVSEKISPFDMPVIVGHISRHFSAKFLKDTIFKIEEDGLNEEQLLNLCVGWGWADYRYDIYKKDDSPTATLLWPEKVDKDKVEGIVRGVCLIRNLVNTPANDMGPQELVKAATKIAEEYKAKIEITHDEDLKKEFPLIFTVGDSSERRPALIDMTWGNAKHPKVTLVGKGVCFDTGGLDLKPPRFMLQMKKDMGGAAHVLGLASLIMRTRLPVRLRVLIPAVENAVSGRAFRPRDVSQSRLGKTVELSDTDAEGRLVLADALTYACEEKPELLIDFATLTGSARSALGYDIPACFSNNNELAQLLQTASGEVEDQVWQLPLWEPYRKELDSDVADLNNIGNGLGGAIHGGLFLSTFVEKDTDWIHLDVYAWGQNGKPGRPRGGADTGMRAVYAFLEERYRK